MSCIAIFLSITALGTIGIATPAFARRVAAGGQSATSGSARITGRVVADDNGRPVKRVSVELSRLNDPQGDAGPNHVDFSRTVSTDNNGRFDVRGLPAGLYSIRFAPESGFVQLTRARYTVLQEAQAVEMTVRLERAGAIEGSIQDENGDLIPGVQVQAVRRFKSGSLEALGTSGASGTTNDRGQFRLFNVPAGEYYVVAHTGGPQRSRSRACVVSIARDSGAPTKSTRRISRSATGSTGHRTRRQGHRHSFVEHVLHLMFGLLLQQPTYVQALPRGNR